MDLQYQMDIEFIDMSQIWFPKDDAGSDTDACYNMVCSLNVTDLIGAPVSGVEANYNATTGVLETLGVLDGGAPAIGHGIDLGGVEDVRRVAVVVERPVRHRSQGGPGLEDAGAGEQAHERRERPERVGRQVLEAAVFFGLVGDEQVVMCCQPCEVRREWLRWPARAGESWRVPPWFRLY